MLSQYYGLICFPKLDFYSDAGIFIWVKHPSTFFPSRMALLVYFIDLIGAIMRTHILFFKLILILYAEFV